jgi:hypothetical protein
LFNFVELFLSFFLTMQSVQGWVLLTLAPMGA